MYVLKKKGVFVSVSVYLHLIYLYMFAFKHPLSCLKVTAVKGSQKHRQSEIKENRLVNYRFWKMSPSRGVITGGILLGHNHIME